MGKGRIIFKAELDEKNGLMYYEESPKEGEVSEMLSSYVLSEDGGKKDMSRRMEVFMNTVLQVLIEVGPESASYMLKTFSEVVSEAYERKDKMLMC